MSTQEKEKQELIEMFGVYFEEHHNLPPLSGRIMGTLIMNCRIKGLTYEELVAMTNASKSSVSTNINLLLKLGKINYYTIPGQRKKFFRPSNLADRIQNHLKILRAEMQMVNRVKAYDTVYAISQRNEKNEKVMELYMEYVQKFEQLLLDSIKKINDLEQ